MSFVAVVLIASGSGLAQTNTFPTTGSVGIGTTTPTDKLEAVGANGSFVKSTSTQSGSNNWAGFQTKSWVGGASATWTIGGGSILGGGTAFGIFNDVYTNMRLWIDGGTGNVGIGTTAPAHLLHVAGAIGAKEIIVSSTGADYVFAPDYRLTPLKELSEYVSANHHLPGVPSASDMQTSGMRVGELEAKLLAKIEELTLHMIRADERATRLQEDNADLRRQLENMRKQ